MGTIVTFYSYKGGVGRTMALANIATLLAQRGRRVLCIDWDLEAPGLDRYLGSLGVGDVDIPQRAGLLELLESQASGDGRDLDPRWRDHLISLEVPGQSHSGRLDLLSSGRRDAAYPTRVLDFDWTAFFEQHGGGHFIERLRDDWKAEYDVTLIDSRTGYTDSGGICTIQLPDILALVFVANHQSLEGAKDAAQRAQKSRQKLSFDRMPLLVFPIAARWDGTTEFEESQRWLDRFAETLQVFYEDWLPQAFTARQMLEHTKLPYVPFFSFGEKLPVLSQGVTDPAGLGHAYGVAAELIARDFRDADEVIRRALPVVEEPTKHDVFIAYNFATRSIARLLVAALEGHELDAWWAERDVAVGTDLHQNIEREMERSRVAAFLIDGYPSAFQSHEIHMALGLARRHAGVRIVPIYVGGIPPHTRSGLPLEFTAIKGIELTETSDVNVVANELRRVIDNLNPVALTAEPYATPQTQDELSCSGASVRLGVPRTRRRSHT